MDQSPRPAGRLSIDTSANVPPEPSGSGVSGLASMLGWPPDPDPPFPLRPPAPTWPPPLPDVPPPAAAASCRRRPGLDVVVAGDRLAADYGTGSPAEPVKVSVRVNSAVAAFKRSRSPRCRRRADRATAPHRAALSPAFAWRGKKIPDQAAGQRGGADAGHDRGRACRRSSRFELFRFAKVFVAASVFAFLDRDVAEAEADAERHDSDARNHAVARFWTLASAFPTAGDGGGSRSRQRLLRRAPRPRERAPRSGASPASPRARSSARMPRIRAPPRAPCVCRGRFRARFATPLPGAGCRRARASSAADALGGNLDRHVGNSRSQRVEFLLCELRPHAPRRIRIERRFACRPRGSFARRWLSARDSVRRRLDCAARRAQPDRAHKHV